jgi:hypothetical protein
VKMRPHLAGLAVGVLAILGSATATTAAPPPENPAHFCKETNNADGYLASTGGCVSSVASIGIDALMAGAFPSRAAAVATCRNIADMAGGFPYYFYGREGDDRYLATNINSCVRILYNLHTGQLEPGPAAG